MQSETDDGVLQGTKGLQLSVLLRWPGYQSIAHRQWKMESLSIPETNTVWRPRMKEPFFDCFNLFYNNCCPECSLSKSRLPIAVSDWIWTLKCFRSHTNHCSQHHPKTAVSSKALVLIFWEQRKSLIINKRIALIMLMPGACFVSKNPLPLVLVVNIYPLYNVALVFIHFEDGTVEGNGQALGCLYGGDNRLGQGHEKNHLSQSHTWRTLILAGGGAELCPVLGAQNLAVSALLCCPQPCFSKRHQNQRCTEMGLTQRKPQNIPFRVWKSIVWFYKVD